MKKRGIALIWALVFSSTIAIISATMANSIIKESRFTLNIQDSSSAFYGARTGMEWAKHHIGSARPASNFSEDFNIDFGGTMVRIEVDATYNAENDSYTVLSTGRMGDVTRRLEYVFRDAGWVYQTIPQNFRPFRIVDERGADAQNTESFSLQFDYWQPGTGSHYVGISNNQAGQNQNKIVISNNDGRIGIRAYHEGDMAREGEIGFNVNDDFRQKIDPFRYRIRIDYVKNVSATLTVFRMIMSEDERVETGRNIGEYSCVGSATIDLVGFDFGNMDRIYYDDGRPTGPIQPQDNDIEVLRTLFDTEREAFFANFMVRIP